MRVLLHCPFQSPGLAGDAPFEVFFLPLRNLRFSEPFVVPSIFCVSPPHGTYMKLIFSLFIFSKTGYRICTFLFFPLCPHFFPNSSKYFFFTNTLDLLFSSLLFVHINFPSDTPTGKYATTVSPALSESPTIKKMVLPGFFFRSSCSLRIPFFIFAPVTYPSDSFSSSFPHWITPFLPAAEFFPTCLLFHRKSRFSCSPNAPGLS